jgi:hypothetical protein
MRAFVSLWLSPLEKRASPRRRMGVCRVWAFACDRRRREQNERGRIREGTARGEKRIEEDGRMKEESTLSGAVNSKLDRQREVALSGSSACRWGFDENAYGEDSLLYWHTWYNGG